MSSYSDVGSVIRACRGTLYGTHSELTINMAGVKGFNATAIVPIAAVVDASRERGARIRLHNLPKGLEKTGFRNPLEATNDNLRDGDPMHRLWTYSGNAQTNQLTSAFLDRIHRLDALSKGVYDGLEWCLNETLDNVNNHSESEHGFVMVTHHPGSKTIEVAIADSGIGIHKSLKSSNMYEIDSAYDALTKAFQQGVTRNQKTNQGNGLYGLHDIVRQTGGTLEVVSGNGRIKFSPNPMEGKNDQTAFDKARQGTYISFRIPTNQNCSLAKTFNKDDRNYTSYTENFEEHSGAHVVSVKDHSGGTGTRESAREFSNIVRGLLNNDIGIVHIDFTGLQVISSSFADEAIGKLCYDLGIINFMKRIRLTHYSDSIAALIDAATWKRIASEETEAAKAKTEQAKAKAKAEAENAEPEALEPPKRRSSRRRSSTKSNRRNPVGVSDGPYTTSSPGY